MFYYFFNDLAPMTAGVLLFLLSFFFAILSGQLIVPFLRRTKLANQPIRDDGPLSHLSKAGTPTLGGSIILVATFIASMLFLELNFYTVTMLFASFSFASLGFIDDFYKLFYKNHKGISARAKLLLQIFFALLFYAALFYNKNLSTLVYLPYFGFVDFSYLYAPFVVLIFLGTANGTNLTDGLDGLLSIPAITSILTFAYLLFYKNNYSLLFYSFVYIGAILGFLWYNGGFAEIFMGDTGSMSIGGTIAALAVFSKFELLLPICGIIFVIESLSVIIQVLYFKMTGGKRFFKMAPIHHHFEKCDLPEQKIVIRFWIIAIIAAIFSIFIINMCIF